MITYKGNAVSKGIAEGKILFLETDKQKNFDNIKISNTEKEIQRLLNACNTAVAQLMDLYDKALESSADEASDIFMVHGMMLQDDDFIKAMEDLIQNKKCCAEYAVAQVAKEFAADLADSGSDYIAERGSDVSDVSARVINILQGKDDQDVAIKTPIILIAEELTPSQTLMFDRSQLLALVSKKGSATSHTAILARSLNIPAIICPELHLSNDLQNCKCIVDGLTGAIIINPSAEIAANAEKKRSEFLREQQELESLKDREAITHSNQRVKIYGNAGNLEDIDSVLAAGGEGIGLFRSEFLYLGRETLPSEDELAQVYSNAAKKLKDKILVIRTLDIGADKTAPCLPMEHEENPALGIRALRLCFETPDVFMTQLKSILRAAINGNVAIMFPMIISLSEIKKAKEMINKAAEELRNKDVAFSMPKEIGIMIETPAAALISDVLAKEVDFFSIGSNDLTQYTLAIDRQNARLDKYCDTHHEAVLRLIELTAENAHKNNIWVGICGEVGADLELTERFVKAGIDELSVYAGGILPLKKRIIDL